MPSDGSHHTAEGSSRKRIKISRDASRPAGMSQTPDSRPVVSHAKVEETAATVENDLHTDGTPCHHEQSYRSLNDSLDTMRQLITCKICQRFLYEPYALTCGHTFCYSCLSQWLGQNKKKTCPDCRTVIKEEPSPSYLVREMVLVFVGKSELLPDGETAEEHHRYAKEEAEIVARDKANTDARTGGLFKGSFKRGGRLMPLEAIRDQNDNVDRCPQCLHEVEDGRCNVCDIRVRGRDDELDLSEDSDEDSDLDYDLDDEDPAPFDDYPGFMYDPENFDEDLDDFDYGYPPPFIPNHGPVSDVSDEESDEDDHDPSMDGFIDDGPQRAFAMGDSSDVNGDSDDTEMANSRLQERMRAAHVIISDDDEEEDDDEDEMVQPRRRRLLTVRRPAPSSRPSEEPSSAGAGPSLVSDDDDEGPVTASQRSRLGRRPIVRLRDESDEDDSDEQTDTPSRYGGFSPLQYDLTEETDEEDHENGHDYHDRYDGFSATSGPTELSDDHYEDHYGHDHDDDGESDGSGDGWGPNSQRAFDEDQGLTRAADTPATSRGPPHASSHRLHTLGSRRNRHADPLSDSPPSYSSLFPARPSTQYTRRLEPQPPPRRRPLLSEVATFFPNRPTRPANPAFQPVRPIVNHPFNLENTLASVNSRRNDAPFARYTARNTQRNNSNVSSQSSASAGGVRVGSEESGSGSSGSSRTLRGDGASRRRRPFAEIEDEASD